MPMVQVGLIRGIRDSVMRMWSIIEEPRWFMKVGWRLIVR